MAVINKQKQASAKPKPKAKLPSGRDGGLMGNIAGPNNVKIGGTKPYAIGERGSIPKVLNAKSKQGEPLASRSGPTAISVTGARPSVSGMVDSGAAARKAVKPPSKTKAPVAGVKAPKPPVAPVAGSGRPSTARAAGVARTEVATGSGVARSGGVTRTEGPRTREAPVARATSTPRASGAFRANSAGRGGNGPGEMGEDASERGRRSGGSKRAATRRRG